MTDADEQQLPPAHPLFAAHFTSPIYDPDDFMQDEVPPFGTDEGSDEIHEWAERLEELRAHPTLRHLLGKGADTQIEELRETEQVDVDDIVIGLGFTLLRFTGQIDSEGREWLLEALTRQDERLADGPYAVMIKDLSSFGSTGGRDPLPGDPVQQKLSRTWFVVEGAQESDAGSSLRSLERSIRDDPAWRSWWSMSGIERLHLVAIPMGRDDVDSLSFLRDRNRLTVAGTDRRLAQVFNQRLRERGRAASAGIFDDPEIAESVRALILHLLRETGHFLRLDGVPEQLPSS